MFGNHGKYWRKIHSTISLRAANSVVRCKMGIIFIYMADFSGDGNRSNPMHVYYARKNNANLGVATCNGRSSKQSRFEAVSGKVTGWL